MSIALSANTIQIASQSLSKPLAPILLFNKLDSTNTYLKQYLNQPNLSPAHYYLCLSEQQHAGRGRFGRQWQSPAFDNIYASIGLFHQGDIQQLMGLSQVVGLSIVQSLQQHTAADLKVKWPNDIYVADQKLAGNLIELSNTSNDLAVIIGIGINVNSTTILALERPWTSLRQLSHKAFDRNILLIDLIQQLDDDLRQFWQHGFAAFLSRWQQYDYLHGQTITLNNGQQQLSGQYAGLDRQGNLQLQDQYGQLKTIHAGEASLQTTPHRATGFTDIPD